MQSHIEKRYGIVKNKYGNYCIGEYNFTYQGNKPRFNMGGIICRKNGIEVRNYIQWVENMLPTDYPYEISKEVYDKITTIIRNNVAEVKNIISLQPTNEMSHQLNSKCFVKTDRFFYVGGIKSISSTPQNDYYDEVIIGEDEFLILKYSSTSLSLNSLIAQGEGFALSDSIYDYIKDKAFQITKLLQNLCASNYKPFPLDVPSL